MFLAKSVFELKLTLKQEIFCQKGRKFARQTLSHGVYRAVVSKKLDNLKHSRYI